jgi:3-keto-disaccharide hydrolase/TIR domain-containing protein
MREEFPYGRSVMAVSCIFVSYYFASISQRDYQVAMQLAGDLRAKGADVVVEGATVRDERVKAYLNQELPRCQWFILILTPEAVNSPRIRGEVDMALNMYRHGSLVGLLAFWLVPPDRSAIPPTWSVLDTCDASRDYLDGLSQVLQKLELAQHDPSSLYEQEPPTIPVSFPPSEEDEQGDTIVPPREDSEDTAWGGTTQRYAQQGTGPTSRNGQDIPGQRYSQDIPGARRYQGYNQHVQGTGQTLRDSQDIPTARYPGPESLYEQRQRMPGAGPTPRQSQNIPGADPFHGYDQPVQSTGFPLPEATSLTPRPSVLRLPPRLWLIIVAAVLVVLLVVGSLVSIVTHLGSSSSGTSGNASQNATATAIVAKANATALAMASTPQGLYALVMQRQPTLSDTLAAQHTNQWDVNSSQSGSCAFTGGAYHASITVANQHTACMSRKADFKNFAYQAQVTLINGDAGGLIFRSDNAVSTFYRFAIDSTGAYRLFSCQGCTGNQNAGNVLAFGDLGIKANQPNTLTVIAINNTINLYVNGQFVKSVTDTTATSGELGVYAGTFVQAFMHPTEVAFSNVKVWVL